MKKIKSLMIVILFITIGSVLVINSNVDNVNEIVQEDEKVAETPEIKGELIKNYNNNGKEIYISREKVLDSNVYYINIKLKDSNDFKHVLPSKVRNSEYKIGDINSKELISEQVREYNPILAINCTAFTKHNSCTDDISVNKSNHIEGCNNNILLPTWGPIGSNSKLEYVPRSSYSNSSGSHDGWSRPALLLTHDGTLELLKPTDENLNNLRSEKIKYNWLVTYGPVLVEDGEVTEEAIKYKDYKKGPLTTIGQKKNNKNEFLIIIVDGRIEESISIDSNVMLDDSKGFNIKDVAELYKTLGYNLAYNLDGGGSSTLYYDYEILNIPVDTLDINNNMAGSSRKLYDGLYIER